MWKFFLVLALTAVPFWTPMAGAQSQAGLGYRVDLPEGWHALDQQYIRSDATLLPAAVENADKGPWKSADKQMLGNVKEMVSSGDVDYYINPDYPGSIISVTRTGGDLPATKAEVTKLCQALPDELSKMVGRSVQVYECRNEAVGSANALFVTADGYSEGSKSHLYEIQRAPGQILVFTATCQDQSCAAMHEELTKFVRSVRF